MNKIISTDPFRCRMWDLHDRMETTVNEETCRAEIESFQRHGQLVPTLGRPLVGDSRHNIELIYGARRLFIAQTLNKPLLVEVRQMSDTEAVVAMHIENRHRKDVSPYEQGLSYARLLRSKRFESQDEIARALHVSASQVSRLLKLSRLPAVLVAAFRDPATICEDWGLRLLEAWEDPGRRPSVVAKARAIAANGNKLSPRDVYGHLLASATKGRALQPKARDEVVSNGQGRRPLFRIRTRGKWVMFLLPLETVSSNTLSELRTGVTRILQDADVEQRKANEGQECFNGNSAVGANHDIKVGSSADCEDDTAGHNGEFASSRRRQSASTGPN